MLKRLLPTSLAVLSFATGALATDFFVDSAQGDDLNGNGSQAAPWLTITHALSAIPSPPPGSTHRILVAPGAHDFSMGEEFPLVMRSGIHLESLGGSEAMPLVLGRSTLGCSRTPKTA